MTGGGGLGNELGNEVEMNELAATSSTESLGVRLDNQQAGLESEPGSTSRINSVERGCCRKFANPLVQVALQALLNRCIFGLLSSVPSYQLGQCSAVDRLAPAGPL